MLPRERFDSFYPSQDPYAGGLPDLQLDDLPEARRDEPRLSYLVSTWNRQTQLARSLECLARQTWREFEVLLCDDGSTQDIQTVAELFESYLNIHYYRLERDRWHSCPSRAFRHMLPEARGEVVAISHPEMMLHPSAMEYLYRGCLERLDDAHYYGVDHPERTEGEWYWVSLKPCFLDEHLYRQLDAVDWHTDWNAIRKLPGFFKCGGFAGRDNAYHMEQQKYPWWFVGAARRDCPIWAMLPITDSHGIIDMWLMGFRRNRNVVDVTPYEVLCLHQPHQITAIGVKGEQDEDRLQVRPDA